MSSGKKGGSTSIPMPDVGAMLGQQNSYNRLNQYGPNGNLLYGKVGEDGQFQADSQMFPYAVQQQQSPHQDAMRKLGEIASMSLAKQIGAQAMTNLQPLRAGNERAIEGSPLTGGLIGQLGGMAGTGGLARSLMPRR